MGKKCNKNTTTTQIIRELIKANISQPIIVYIEEIETSLGGFQNDYAIEFLSLFSRK